MSFWCSFLIQQVKLPKKVYGPKTQAFSSEARIWNMQCVWDVSKLIWMSYFIMKNITLFKKFTGNRTPPPKLYWLLNLEWLTNFEHGGQSLCKFAKLMSHEDTVVQIRHLCVVESANRMIFPSYAFVAIDSICIYSWKKQNESVLIRIYPFASQMCWKTTCHREHFCQFNAIDSQNPL